MCVWGGDWSFWLGLPSVYLKLVVCELLTVLEGGGIHSRGVITAAVFGWQDPAALR